MSENSARKYNRRDALQIGAAGAAALGGLALAPKAKGIDCTVAPAMTEGPYWVEEMLNRADIRSDPATGVVQPGLAMRLAINVSETTAGVCAPVSGAYVDLWHCDALGVYSDVTANNSLGKKFLRGYQVTDAHGNVRFITIYPGWYNGRTVHIHARVRKFSGSTATFNFTTQLFFNDAITTGIYARVAPYNTRGTRSTLNSGDGIYSGGGAQMLLRMADDGSHAIASCNIVINAVPGLIGTVDEESLEHMHDFGGGTPPLPIERLA